MTHRYFSAPGSGLSDTDAETIGRRVSWLGQAGEATPERLVEDARPEQSATHRFFEWDDVAAAEQYRVGQAKHYLSNIYVVRADARTPIRADQLVRVSRPTPEPLTLQGLSGSRVAAARADLARWQQRYGELREVELAAHLVREALDALTEPAEQTA